MEAPSGPACTRPRESADPAVRPGLPSIARPELCDAHSAPPASVTPDSSEASLRQSQSIQGRRQPRHRQLRQSHHRFRRLLSPDLIQVDAELGRPGSAPCPWSPHRQRTSARPNRHGPQYQWACCLHRVSIRPLICDFRRHGAVFAALFGTGCGREGDTSTESSSD